MKPKRHPPFFLKIMSLLDIEELEGRVDNEVVKWGWRNGFPNQMVRTFHAVGHGAFYTERFFGRNNEPLFCAVYDCGGKGMSSMVQRTFMEQETINLLFISHLHHDHINGVMKLLSYCHVERIVLPALEPNSVLEAILFNYICSLDFASSSLVLIERLLNGDLGETEITEVNAVLPEHGEDLTVELGSLGKKLSSGTAIVVHREAWRYIPINIETNNASLLLAELEKAANVSAGYFLDGHGRLDYAKVKKAVALLGVTKCKKIYERIFGKSHNSYSMPVFSVSAKCLEARCHQFCHCVGSTPMNCHENCLYMGDFEATTKYKQLEIAYQTAGIDYKKIGILQVPHHGSERNRNDELYKSNKLCVISAGNHDRYKHPDESVLYAIQHEQSVPIIVTENHKTEQRFRLSY